MLQFMEVIFFDLDGTIINSCEGVTKSVAYALGKMGIAVPEQKVLETFIGPPLLDSLMNTISLSKEKGKEAILIYREYYESKGVYQNILYPDIVTVLSRLHEMGKRLFVVTSKPELYARDILRQFKIDIFFENVFGASMDRKLSEKEQIIAKAIENIEPKINPLSTLMVGDRKFDILGAKAHALKSCAVLYGFGSKEELTKAGADYLVSNALEIMDCIV